MNRSSFVIIGAGIWGLAMARLIAEELHESVTVIEQKNHLGGNCHSYFDSTTGIECHKYGSHIFHTSIPEVWAFITRFGSFNNYRHKVLAVYKGKTYELPINLMTINALYGTNYNPFQAREFICREAAKCGINAPANLEEKALSQIGRKLYDAFIKGYTSKQWGLPPAELPQAIISRLPVRFSYNSDYFSDPWQGVPLDGYGILFKRMADHPLITIQLNTEFNLKTAALPSCSQIIYTGLPDKLFDYKYGALEWRSLEFEWETVNVPDFQGTSVINYTDVEVPYTRIHEFKHYNPERQNIFTSGKTIICREYPKTWQTGAEAYYPVTTEKNLLLYDLYKKEAKKRGIVLGGRLGGYKYLDMDKAIYDAMSVFRSEILQSA